MKRKMRLNKEGRKIVKVALVFSLVMSTLFYSFNNDSHKISAEGATILNASELIGRTLSSGTYKIIGSATHEAAVGENVLKIAKDSNVTLILEGGTLDFKGGDAQGKDITGAAAIFLPESSTLNIKGSGEIIVKGGNASNGENGSQGQNGAEGNTTSYGGNGGIGGAGAGAGIGGNGAKGGNVSQNGFDVVDSCGSINIFDTVKIEATGGSGGSGGGGGSGGASFGIYTAFTATALAAGAGGGGGGGGYPAAGIGSGGAGGGGGGRGGNGYGDTLPAFGITADIIHYGGGGGGAGGGYGAGSGGSAGRGSIYRMFTVIVTFNPDRVDSTPRTAPGDEGVEGNKDWVGMSGGRGGKGTLTSGGAGGDSRTDDKGADGGNPGKNRTGAPDIYISTKASVISHHGGAEGKTTGNATDIGTGGGVGSIVETIKEKIITLADCTVTIDKSSFKYNGRAQKPNITVKYGTNVLRSSAYDIEYFDDLVNVGTKTIKVIGKEDKSTGAYLFGEQSTLYRITKADQTPSITSSEASIELGQTVTINVNQNKSNGNVDWVLTDNSVKTKINRLSNGTVQLEPEETGIIEIYANVAGNESYNAAKTNTLKVSVTPQGISNFHIEGVVDKVYTGQPLYQDNLIISYEGTILKENVDYKLHYDPNVEVGIVVIEVEGIGERTGRIYTSYQILPRSIKEAKITTPKDLTYTGKSQTSPVEVKYDGKILEKDVDYSVVYDEQINAGQVTAIITGIGNYTDSTETHYNILPMTLTNENTNMIATGNFTYNGQEAESGAIITQDGNLLSLQDYDLKYENNVNAGEAIVKAIGKGNYKGVISTTFTIDKARIDIIPDENQWKYKGAEEPTLTFTYQGAVLGETLTFDSSTALARAPGESVGVFAINIGDLALDSTNSVNKNYYIQLNTYRLFEIRKFIIPDEATLEGTMGKDDWYVSRVNIVAPNDYLISTTDGNDAVWTTSISYDDGDYSANGAVYYLKQISTGYISDYKTITYKQDTHGAESRIIVNDSKSWNGMYPTPSFKKTFFNKDANIAVFGDDELSGIDVVQYLLSSDIMDEEDLKTLPENQWISITNDEKIISSDSDKHIVYVKMQDKAGNYSYGRSDGFIIDKVKPTITYIYDLENIWTSDANASISIKVTDDVAGLKDRYVDYTINGDTQLIQLDEQGNGTITHLPDGDYTLTISAEDNAGNIQTQDIHVKKDTFKPQISASGDTETYATEQKVTLDIKVGASNIDKVYMQYVPAGAEVNVNGTWEDITDSYRTNGGYIAQKNGTYYFKVVSVVGLESDMTSIGFSRIDREKPVVNHSMQLADMNVYVDNTWTNQTVKISFTNSTANLGTSIYEYSDDYGTTWHALELTDGYCSIVLENSDEHDIWLRITSAAKVESDIMRLNINIDKVNPYGQIHIGENNWRYLLKVLTCNLFYKDTTDLIISPVDDLSGIGKVEYFVLSGDKTIYDNPPDTPNSVERLVSLNGGWSTGSRNSFTPNNKYNVGYAKITDQAGNVCYLSTDGFLTDNQKPVIQTAEVGLSDYGSYGKWFNDVHSSVTFEMSDSLSGLDFNKISYQIDTDEVQKVTLENNSFTINELKDGKYTIQVIAYDLAGNEQILNYQVQKDTASPRVNIIADTENYALSVDSRIEVSVGPSGIQKVESQFVEENKELDETKWQDVTSSYENNVKINKKGTYYVRLTDKLNRQSTSTAVFDKIQYVAAKANAWVENSKGEKVDTTEWINSDGNICFANDPANVKGFTYQYREKGEITWTNVDADEKGIARFKALPGEHTYEMNVSNGTEQSQIEITVKADNTMPNGVLTYGEIDPNTNQLTSHSIRQSLFDNNKIGIFHASTSNKALILSDVQDGTDESGIASISYYTQKSAVNEYITEFPHTPTDIEKMVKTAGGWDTTLNEQQWKDLLNGQDKAKLDIDLQMNRSYVVYVKIVDHAGNARYISSDGFAFDNRRPNIETDYKANSWLNKKSQGVRVYLTESIGGMGDCSYTINGNKHIVSELSIINESFIIPLSEFKNGENTIELSAENKLGIAAENKVITVFVDKDTPALSIRGNTTDYAINQKVDIEVQPIISGIDKVEVQFNNGEWTDITDSYEEGYIATKNGEYLFRVTSHAGNVSLNQIIEFDKIDGATPTPVIEGYEVQNENVLDKYDPGTWTSNDVELTVFNKEDNYGTSTVEYKFEEESQWKELGDLPDTTSAQVLKIEDAGPRNIQFKITSQLGAESPIEEVPVLIDREKPQVQGKLLESNWKKDTVAISIDAKDQLSGVQAYSFDGGQTFIKSNQVHIDKNQIVEVAAKDKVGNISTAQLEVNNVDKLLPDISTVKLSKDDWAKSKDVSAKVVDKEATAEYGKSGINYVFLTSHNPYSGKTVTRTSPSDDDILMRNVGNSDTYTTSKPVAKYIGDIDSDNYYIVAVDEAGNASVTSLCVNKIDGIKTPVNPDNTDNGGDTNGPDHTNNPNDSTNNGQSGSDDNNSNSENNGSGTNNNGSGNSGNNDNSYDSVIDNADSIINNGNDQSSNSEDSDTEEKDSIIDVLDKIEELIKGGELTPEQVKALEGKKTELIHKLVTELINEDPGSTRNIQRNMEYIQQLLQRDDLTSEQREELTKRYQELSALYEKNVKQQAVYARYFIILIVVVLAGSLAYTQYCKRKANQREEHNNQKE